MNLPVAIVTGATGGIGRSIALGLARSGHHVVMTGRDAQRGAAAIGWIEAHMPQASLQLKMADLSSLAETRALGAAILQDHSAIAVLVNNAGIFLHRRETTPEGHEKVLAVNHLSPFVLTDTLLPALSAAGNARIVTIGSDTSDKAKIDPDDLELRRGWNMVRAYSRAKLAQMMTSFVLAERLAGSGTTVNVVHPGAVATSLVRSPGVIGLSWKIMSPFLLTEEQGADTPLHVAISPAIAGTTRRYFKKKTMVPPNKLALSRELNEQVWAATEKLVQA